MKQESHNRECIAPRNQPKLAHRLVGGDPVLPVRDYGIGRMKPLGLSSGIAIKHMYRRNTFSRRCSPRLLDQKTTPKPPMLEVKLPIMNPA